MYYVLVDWQALVALDESSPIQGLDNCCYIYNGTVIHGCCIH